MARKQPKQIPQMTVAQFEAAFPNEDACDAYLVARRWPNGVIARAVALTGLTNSRP